MINVDYRLNIDESAVDEFLTNPINEKKIDKAIDRALKKTTRWLSSQSAKMLSSKLDVALKSIKSRLFINTKKSKDGKVSLWIGLNDMHAHTLGAMRQTKAGISVRSHRFKGAFINATRNSEKLMGWRRASSEHASDDDEVRNYILGAIDQNHEAWPRYPLRKVGLQIYDESTPLLVNQEKQLAQRFNTILHQELNYEFNVKA